ncbi:MAG: orotate phosphoribosyltransferase [Deltaproteobacteria bacterium]|nr:MAG: orotate phosphoribosyltransferase [Deltaproteobacteria bacterium]
MSRIDAPALHRRLVEILRQRSVRRGHFVLASGRESDLYIDCRLTTLHAEGAATIAALVLDRLAPEVVGVGGPVTGADPIVGAVLAAAWQHQRPLDGFMVRKEPKGHGLKQWVEGRANLAAGAPVCVVEDTVTTGGSLLRAIQRVEESGLRVVQVIAVVDRQEGAAERIAAAGYTLETLVGRDELG